jgi:hypothetical protein
MLDVERKQKDTNLSSPEAFLQDSLIQEMFTEVSLYQVLL